MEYNMNAKKTTIVDSGLLLYLFLIILSYSYFCLLILIFACSSLMSLQKIRNFQCFFFHRAPDIARFVDARNILQGSTARISRHKGYSCAPGPFSLKGGWRDISRFICRESRRCIRPSIFQPRCYNGDRTAVRLVGIVHRTKNDVHLIPGKVLNIIRCIRCICQRNVSGSIDESQVLP